ncbi:hypothetical protein ACRE_090890 [Hapsidospora chrysogenum ATCC 11550]|uniref:Serine palmitoyltransferase-like protein n=1 Tax=Hapsidospora chrysogenum (strain ATCC 11550 / CBS 779.69 / DSM 880 / IAM 14645 / JCM 23072 / IMI 49137) TaxID=857340 RepID=A0A086ST19_HAPC1|nr:hypothetical protein ACRE_090890 [Hapsidospora chrysogenum ATCC 11550]
MAQRLTFQQWLQRKLYHFELSLSVYMMTPGEKFAFYSILFLLCGLTCIAMVLYLPHHISFLVGRAWYYINGEHIDVGEVVKGELASVLHETATTVAEAVSDAAETVVKEL